MGFGELSFASITKNFNRPARLFPEILHLVLAVVRIAAAIFSEYSLKQLKIYSLMKSLLVIVLMLFACTTASAQFVAKMEIIEPIEGLCSQQNVYALLPLKGQEEAVCPLSKEEVQNRLNKEVAFLKENPAHSDKGMVSLIINCKGEVVKCEMDNKTKSPELDEQIVAVFNTLGSWKPGKLKGKKVDSVHLLSFTLANGEILLE